MDWIKKNYEQAALILLSIILLAVSIMLMLRALDFQSVFAGIQGQVPQSKKLDPVDMESTQKAQAALAQPPTWTSTAKSELFVTERWVSDQGALKPVTGEGMINPPIPNEWLQQYDLELLDPDVLSQDPDNDGFTTLEEFQGGVKDDSGRLATDPTKKESHPPFTTKLFLKDYKEVPFLITFKAQPDPDTFQINVPGLRSQFVKVGDVIRGAAGKTFNVLSFEPKTITTASGTEQDVSELTIEEEASGKKIVLPKGQTIDSPDSYGVFSYLWNGTEFNKSKGDVFTLKPDETVEYKVLDIKPTGAGIENLKTAEKISIPKMAP